MFREEVMYAKGLQLLLAFSLLLAVTSTAPHIIETENVAGEATTDIETESNCTASYKVLASELLKKPSNYFNLQMTFFPPNDTSPDFVIVKYTYDSDSDSGTTTVSHSQKVWFWSSAVYFFYHPIRIFQFTSLGFSDPLLHPSFLTIDLPAECVNASQTYMQLLTQRLKLYAMHQKLHAPIDINYDPKSHSIATLIEWHRDNPRVSRIVISAQFVFPFLATVFLLLFFIYIIELEPRNFGRKLNNQINSSVNYIQANGEAKILIILTISVLFNICTIITDGFALHEYNKLSAEVKQYYDQDIIEFRYFYIIPYVMTAFDIFSWLFIIIPISVTAVRYFCRNRNRQGITDDNPEPDTPTNWSFLLYSLLAPISCIATHAYHIIIAFIDNTYHAGSVLLLYITVLFIHVVVFQKIYYYLVKWTKSEDLSSCCDPIKNNKCYWLIFLIGCYIVGVTTLSVIIGLTVSMLMLLPIDNAIDNAPNNIYAIYQGSVAIIAALVAFQVFFRETNSLTEVFIKAQDHLTTDNGWTRMSEKEKELQLAKLFLEYISRPPNGESQQRDQPPPGGDGPHGDRPPPGGENPHGDQPLLGGDNPPGNRHLLGDDGQPRDKPLPGGDGPRGDQPPPGRDGPRGNRHLLGGVDQDRDPPEILDDTDDTNVLLPKGNGATKC